MTKSTPYKIASFIENSPVAPPVVRLLGRTPRHLILLLQNSDKHKTRYPLWLAGFHCSYNTNLTAFKNRSDFRFPSPVPLLPTSLLLLIGDKSIEISSDVFQPPDAVTAPLRNPVNYNALSVW